MINVKQHVKNLAKVVSSIVGNKLSQSKGSSGMVPSVLIARQNNPKRDLPYAICDYIGVLPYGPRELYRETLEDGSTVVHFSKIIRLRVSFHGNVKNDVLSIADELRDMFYTSSGSSILTQYMNGAELLSVSEPVFSDNLINTDYEELSILTLDFTYVGQRIFTGSDSTTINTIDYSGELFEDYEDDDDPLNINQVITNT